MWKISEVGRTSAVGCEELGRLGYMDTSLCCEICHSVERHVPGVFLGPCRAPLPDGEEALVCCTGKEQLLPTDGVPGRETRTQTRGGTL